MKSEPGSRLQEVSQYIIEYTTSILEQKSIGFTTELGFYKPSSYILSNSSSPDLKSNSNNLFHNTQTRALHINHKKVKLISPYIPYISPYISEMKFEFKFSSNSDPRLHPQPYPYHYPYLYSNILHNTI